MKIYKGQFLYKTDGITEEDLFMCFDELDTADMIIANVIGMMILHREMLEFRADEVYGFRSAKGIVLKSLN